MNSFDKVEFRKMMGLFATGVTVVAVGSDSELHAMTANSFTSVSLDPPLVLVCMLKSAKMASGLRVSGVFSVNFLSESQQDLSAYFAGCLKDKETPWFQFVKWQDASRLDACLGSILCKVENIFDGGDHEIFIGRVLEIHDNDATHEPLLFWRGKYRKVLSS